MEVDGGGASSSGGEGGGGGGESVEMEKKNSLEGETKVKRKMKTPLQLEVLEKTYAVETYPSEALRAELSVKLGLTDRQLQMWFCHRRLKDRNPPTEKKQRKSALKISPVAGTSSGNAHEKVVNNADEAKNSGSGLSLFENTAMQQPHKVGTAVPRISTNFPAMRRFYEPPLAISEQRAIKSVEAQLGEPLREDGPILGMEFDPLPSCAFGAPIGLSKSWGQQWVSPHSFHGLFSTDFGGSINSKGKVLWGVIVPAVCWSVWTERNIRLFENTAEPIEEVWGKIKYLVALWSSNHRIFRSFFVSNIARNWSLVL